MQRSTFLPLHHAATLISLVDWGLAAGVGPDFGQPFRQGPGASAGGGAESLGAGTDVRPHLFERHIPFRRHSPGVAFGTGLRRSPSVATLSRLLQMVKAAELRKALLTFMIALFRMRGDQMTVASMDGKTMRGVWEDGEQLRLWHVFSRQEALALDQVQIYRHLEEPRAAQEWMEQVSGAA